MQYTDRIKAIAWWDVKSTQYKDALTHTHFRGRNVKSLTGREIEIIWRKETQTRKT